MHEEKKCKVKTSDSETPIKKLAEELGPPGTNQRIDHGKRQTTPKKVLKNRYGSDDYRSTTIKGKNSLSV